MKGLLYNLLKNIGNPGIRLRDNLRLYSGELIKTNIFHSPWLPIPKAYTESQKARCVITVHDLIPVLFPDFFTEGNVNQFKKNLGSITPDTWIICNSNSTRNDLLNYHKNLSPEKVYVTYWAASSMFHPVNDEVLLKQVLKKHGIPDSPYILTLATIEPRKNIAAVLHALRGLILQEKVGDLNLVLVGTKGWKYQEIIDFIESSPELASRVFFTGYIDDTDLAAIYSGAMVFVYPSLYEGFGLPPLEAMQCGLPVICSNTSSLPEVLGNAGILFDPDDIDALADAILNIYSNNAIRKELALKSIVQAGKFSWKRCVDQTISVYKKACNMNKMGKI
jgi:glycosyltransferase involved in cell wall biosynthesis